MKGGVAAAGENGFAKNCEVEEEVGNKSNSNDGIEVGYSKSIK